MNGLCQASSVATLIIPDRAAAEDPAVAEIIRKAEVVFIAGGDQANYIRGWNGTPVQTAINDGIAPGKPIGGTSAGLAVLGEFVYGATGDKPDDKDLASTDVLPNPYCERVVLDRDFLKIPHLENLITDSHFAKRDRMGRTHHPERSEGPLQPASSARAASNCIGSSVRSNDNAGVHRRRRYACQGLIKPLHPCPPLRHNVQCRRRRESSILAISHLPHSTPSTLPVTLITPARENYHCGFRLEGDNEERNYV